MIRDAATRGGALLLSGPGDSFDPATGTAPKAQPLFVVYVPFATEKSMVSPPLRSRVGPGSWIPALRRRT